MRRSNFLTKSNLKYKHVLQLGGSEGEGGRERRRESEGEGGGTGNARFMIMFSSLFLGGGTDSIRNSNDPRSSWRILKAPEWRELFK